VTFGSHQGIAEGHVSESFQAYVGKTVWQIRKQHSHNQLWILLEICKDVVSLLVCSARGMS